MVEEPLKTPLNEFHKKHNGRMVPFAGWEMPVQYTGIIEEHNAVRNAAGLFDVSHMGEALITGPDAAAFIDYIATNNISNMKNNQARYAVMCQPDGGCVDDIIVYKFFDENFMICLNAANAKKDIEWMNQHVKDFDCDVQDASENYAQLAIQGPATDDILSRVTDCNLGDIGYFHFKEAEIFGAPVILARTGYTGEKGFEIYSSPDSAASIAELLLDKGKENGLVLAGLGARDSLRLEMGYSLYGHEISETISPLQAGLGWVVKLKKESDFIGKEALQAEKDNGPKKKIIFFKINDRRIARQDTPVFDGDKEVGIVVSGTHSPALNQPIGSALVDSDASDSANLSAKIRNKDYPLEIVSPPFVKTSLNQ